MCKPHSIAPHTHLGVQLVSELLLCGCQGLLCCVLQSHQLLVQIILSSHELLQVRWHDGKMITIN